MRSVLECGAFCTLRKEVIIISCPYIIRENIGFGRVREHGYYQLDEMAYDLTHDFANADVEVIRHPVYNVIMESGERLSDVDDEMVFKMLSAGLPGIQRCQRSAAVRKKQHSDETPNNS